MQCYLFTGAHLAPTEDRAVHAHVHHASRAADTPDVGYGCPADVAGDDFILQEYLGNCMEVPPGLYSQHLVPQPYMHEKRNSSGDWPHRGLFELLEVQHSGATDVDVVLCMRPQLAGRE